MHGMKDNVILLHLEAINATLFGEDCNAITKQDTPALYALLAKQSFHQYVPCS